MKIHKLAVTVAAALTLYAASAAADNEWNIADARIRLYAPDTWSVEMRADAPETVRASLEAAGALCQIRTPQGRVLFTLKPYDGAPYEEWTAQERSVQGIDETTLTLRALRGETLWQFETRVIGRAASETDEALLRDAASRMIYLGEDTAANSIIEPLSKAAFEAPASIRVTRDDVPLTIDAVPAQSGSGRFTITGTTTPDAILRHFLNGTEYESFRTDKNGQFSVNVRLGMVGTHRVMLQSIVGSKRSTLTWDVEYLRSDAALALAVPTLSVQDDLVTVRGATYPGVEVVCEVGTRSYAATVEENGLFTCDLPMRSSNRLTIAVTASGGGYAKTSTTLTVLRQDAQGATVTLFIEALANLGGKPCLLGRVEDRALCVLCTSLSEFEIGQTVILTVREAGQSVLAAAPGGEASDYTLAELIAREQ